MLQHLGEHDVAALVMEGIEHACANGVLTPDVGGTAKTVDVTRSVVQFIESKVKLAEVAV